MRTSARLGKIYGDVSRGDPAACRNHGLRTIGKFRKNHGGAVVLFLYQSGCAAVSLELTSQSPLIGCFPSQGNRQPDAAHTVRIQKLDARGDFKRSPIRRGRRGIRAELFGKSDASGGAADATEKTTTIHGYPQD